MARFRRRFGGFPRRGMREQLIWNRQGQNQNPVAGADAAFTIFQPAALLGGAGLDERMTVRAVRILLTYAVTAGPTAADVWAFCALYLAGTTEPAQSATFSTAAQEQLDCLDVFQFPLRQNAVNTLLNHGNVIERRIKAMRKVDNDEILLLVVSPFQNTGARDATGRWVFGVTSSVLFQRTRR